MAEFQKVMKQAKRMCEASGDTCLSCPADGGGTCVFIKSPWSLTEEKIADAERIVMDWAEKHPEPRYPTWKEWQEANFPNANVKVSPCAFSDSKSFRCMNHECDACRDFPIPADIAEKLGVKPIGGDER